MGILGLNRMKNRFSLLGFCSACLLLLAWENALGALSEPAPNQCIVCHSQLEGILGKPVEDFKISVHNKWNLSCSDCHGGNPAEPDKVKAKAEGTNYVGKPKPADVPAYCGRCHSDTDYMRKYKPSLPIDQQEKYFTSHHGEQLQQGNETVAQCVSCHGSHAILPPDDPLSQVYPLNIPKTCAHCHADPETMKASGLATDQYEKYTQSVHGKALYEKGDIMGAPTCNDCHGNHGATPPAITSVANVCGTCHVRNREFFAHSRHKEVFDEAELPECSTCHSYHLIIPTSDAMLGTGPESLCMECHEEGDTALQVAASMTHLISSLDTSGKYAEEVLHQAEQKGMLVDDGFFLLKTIR